MVQICMIILSLWVLVDPQKISKFPAWVRLSEGNAPVGVVFRNSKGGQILHGGETMAKHGCWSLLKGGIVSNFTGQAEIIFEVSNFCCYQLGFI